MLVVPLKSSKLCPVFNSHFKLAFNFPFLFNLNWMLLFSILNLRCLNEVSTLNVIDEYFTNSNLKYGGYHIKIAQIFSILQSTW